MDPEMHKEEIKETTISSSYNRLKQQVDNLQDLIIKTEIIRKKFSNPNNVPAHNLRTETEKEYVGHENDGTIPELLTSLADKLSDQINQCRNNLNYVEELIG